MTNFFFRLFSFAKGTQDSKLSTLSITREGAFFNGFKKKKRPTEDLKREEKEEARLNNKRRR